MSFADALALTEGIEGWLTDAQARTLWDAAIRIGARGAVVEIGSFRGRSTIVLALAVGARGRVVAIDPHGGGDPGPQEISPDQARGARIDVTVGANEPLGDRPHPSEDLLAAGVTGRGRPDVLHPIAPILA